MIKSHLKADQADEAHAVQTYGKRQSQHPQLAPMYAEMRGDEKDHFSKLTSALRGLRGAKPKDKTNGPIIPGKNRNQVP